MSTITACRICGGHTLHPVLDLGSTPLANSLLKQEELQKPEETFPLALVFCPECTLLQITETVPPEKLFSHYLYFSSFSDTMVKHAKELAERTIKERELNEEHLVIEIASNDGYLLQHYQNEGVPVLGIEPAKNIAKIAEEKGIPTLNEFFGVQAAKILAESCPKADVIHAHNVLAHVADQNDVIEGMKILLNDDGIIINESPYAIDTIDETEFDQIYHEHLCYFSLTALTHLFAQHDLTIVNVERIAIHGGTLRITAQHTKMAKPLPSARPDDPVGRVKKLLQEEQKWGVETMAPYKEFADRVTHWKGTTNAMLRKLKAEGKSLAAYGASAKGCTLLHYCGLGKDILDFVVDRSTVKQGLYTPGTHLPILPPNALLAKKPDYVLLLTWNFAEEILAQQEAYLSQGGAFIVPFPEPKVLYHKEHALSRH